MSPRKKQEVVAPEEAPKGKLSDEAKAFKAIIELYKVQNPAKYALKKEALEAKLTALSK